MYYLSVFGGWVGEETERVVWIEGEEEWEWEWLVRGCPEGSWNGKLRRLFCVGNSVLLWRVEPEIVTGGVESEWRNFLDRVLVPSALFESSRLPEGNPVHPNQPSIAAPQRQGHRPTQSRTVPIPPSTERSHPRQLNQ
jgi:hypothetical protein